MPKSGITRVFWAVFIPGGRHPASGPFQHYNPSGEKNMGTLFTLISPKELAEKLKKSRPIIIDPLPDEHFQCLHIPGAVNVCVYEVVFAKTVGRLFPDTAKPVVVYSADQNTLEGDVAAEKLLHLGFSEIFILKGGLRAWFDQGLPVKGDAPSGLPQDPHFVAPMDGEYDIDTEESRVLWTGRSHNGSHNGGLLFSSGRLRVAGSSLSGKLEVDVASLSNHDLGDESLRDRLVRHLLSDDFLQAGLFGTAKFAITTARRLDNIRPGGANYHIEGKMTIRDMQISKSFPAIVANHPNGGLVAQADLSLDRTRFGMLYGSGKYFSHLGMHLVYDTINLDIRLVAR